MKKKYRILDFLVFLPLILILVAIPFLPDQVPMHFNLSGEITRIGSKYESFILVGITMAMGVFLKFTGKNAAKKEEFSNEKVSIITGIGIMIWFNGMIISFLYRAFNYANENLPDMDIQRLMFIFFGVALIVIGNIMPKGKLNTLIGIRTKWSMANEKAWFLSQRFGGIVLFLFGIIIIIGNVFFFSGFGSVIFSLGCLILATIITVVFSYIAYKKTL
ncbi:putative membrane protein [Natranaerovirga pectinivora]|uniref:Putative membrane protein n=1 Tax=Natranaerovirga pectinivora TaxID=682400 RepID=A0A4R3MQD5_9FIRM|nr:DUF1648 domain-containing protein [Natranaerovirga pectinivora]TCT14630.1 putative membrane protein [Natranaerovirga pectinivora]